MNTHSTAVSAIVAEIQNLCNEAKVDEKVQRGPKAVFTELHRDHSRLEKSLRIQFGEIVYPVYGKTSWWHVSISS